MQGVLAEGLRQRTAGFDVGLDVQEQFADRRVVVSASDDFKGLQQRHAGLHHRRQLPREQRDVLLGDLSPALEALLGNLADQNPLPPQRGAHDVLAVGAQLAANDLASLVFPFPEKGELLDFCLGSSGTFRGGGHLFPRLQALVLPRISSREVSPCLTFSSPERRRSLTPSCLAWAATSCSVPLAMTMR
jgi:hypothetical protein